MYPPYGNGMAIKEQTEMAATKKDMAVICLLLIVYPNIYLLLIVSYLGKNVKKRRILMNAPLLLLDLDLSCFG